jgi:DNA (cytosine-5)-methyltransferase 1
MRFGSLFSGIGGIDLGLERAGMTCAWQSEIEPYACRVLAKHWPAIPNLGDIRGIDWTTVGTVDVVAGGYPCQPFSVAGRRAGANDERHLWPMFADCLRVVRPRYAMLENVSGHLSLGFGDVQADLATLGYDSRWDCIPAAAVGAPHLRDRVFIIARDTRPEQRRTMADSDNRGSRDPFRSRWDAPWACSTDVADTDSVVMVESRLKSSVATACGTGRHNGGRAKSDGVGKRWPVEPDVGRVAHGIPRRVDRLRGLGNAVVPQVAEHIGRIIMSMEANQ